MKNLVKWFGVALCLSVTVLSQAMPAYADSEAGFRAGSQADSEAQMTPGRRRHRRGGRNRGMRRQRNPNTMNAPMSGTTWPGGNFGGAGAGLIPNGAGVAGNPALGGGRGRAGRGDAAGRKAAKHKQMMQRFDANGDGTLDANEKSQLRAFRRQRKEQKLANGGGAGGQGRHGGGKHRRRGGGGAGGGFGAAQGVNASPPGPNSALFSGPANN